MSSLDCKTNRRTQSRTYRSQEMRECVGYLDIMHPGVYILAIQKNSSPPSLTFFPVFVDFFAVFKLHKGILTCVLSLFFFSSFPPFSFPFFKSSFKFFPVSHFGQNIYPCLDPGHVSAAIQSHAADVREGKRMLKTNLYL